MDAMTRASPGIRGSRSIGALIQTCFDIALKCSLIIGLSLEHFDRLWVVVVALHQSSASASASQPVLASPGHSTYATPLELSWAQGSVRPVVSGMSATPSAGLSWLDRSWDQLCRSVLKERHCQQLDNEFAVLLIHSIKVLFIPHINSVLYVCACDAWPGILWTTVFGSELVSTDITHITVSCLYVIHIPDPLFAHHSRQVLAHPMCQTDWSRVRSVSVQQLLIECELWVKL